MRLDAMNTRVKQEMEPKLAQTEGKLATLETRVGLAQGEQTELNAGVKKALEELGAELDDLTGQVKDMEASVDINSLLMGAAALKP